MDKNNSKQPTFSSSHPSDLLERIIADGAKQNSFENIYRISDSGQCTRDEFVCSVLDDYQRKVNNRDAYLAQKQETYEIDDWSTSCWDSLSKAQGILRLKEKFNDSPSILVGNILQETGYSILTTERVSIQALPTKMQKKKRHHIDWWIFDEQDVSVYFKKLEVL